MTDGTGSGRRGTAELDLADARATSGGSDAGADADVAAMDYETARDALVAVVDELERGGTTLEQSLALWERGEALATRCETWLIGARARLDAARTAESGGSH